MLNYFLMLTKNFRIAVLNITLAALLSGCQFLPAKQAGHTPASSSPVTVTASSVPTDEAPNNQGMQRCRKQLDAIQLIAPAKYPALNNTFNKLMKRASQYSQIRKDINDNTQQTVDAFYLYRITLLCSDISQTLLTGLAHEGNPS
ncbi:hypothetical protein ACGVWS_14135 [Enterobacteriaceae bacterium LUAb1]